MAAMSPASRFTLAVACLLASLLPAHAAAEQTWRELRSPHFRVITDGSDGDGRKVAVEFEQMRHVFAVLFHNDEIESGAPLTIVAVRNTDTYRALEPALWKRDGDRIAGEFHRGWEKQFAVVRLDTWGDENQVVVYHEYTHSILHANTHWLPTWLDEGLAEYYAYTRFENDRILVGAPSRRMSWLQHYSLIPASTMLSVNEKSPYYHDQIQSQVFYAEAWAMVHFMEFGKGMDHGQKLIAFMHMLQDQVPQEKAFQQVFGDPKIFDRQLSQYLSQFAFTAGVIPVTDKLDPKQLPVRVLTPAETAYELGCFHISSHDFATGRTLIEKALALDPKLAGAHEELGFLDFNGGTDEDAQKEWTQAVALDPTLPRSRFALLMTGVPLPQQSPAQLSNTQIALRAITQSAPKFAPPYVELALVEWRMNNLQQAFKDAHQAEVLEPWRAGYRILTGRILLRGKQPALAAQYSHYVATHWFGPDHDEAVDLWEDVPAASRGDDAPPLLDMPPGAKVVRGALTAVTCSAQPGNNQVTATVLPAGPGDTQPLTVTSNGHLMIGFSDTLWYGEDHFSVCHHLAGLPVVLAYKPQGTAGGELVDLEVRDDLPASPAVAPVSGTPQTAAASPQTAAAPSAVAASLPEKH